MQHSACSHSANLLNSLLALARFSEQDLERRYGCECSASMLGLDVCVPMNWLAKYDLALHENGDIGQKYVTSAYFTIIGLSTVGFG